MSNEGVYIHTLVWRLIGDNHIVVTSDDHRHQFGLPQPVDAARKFNDALANRRVVDVDVDSKTGDLRILFSDFKLEIITHSMGYETWTIGRKDSFDTLFVGANGGIL